MRFAGLPSPARRVRAGAPRLRHPALLLLAILGAGASAGAAAAQVRVHPTGVNVNAHGATTVFLTFGGVTDHVPVEAFWCGELMPAAPDVGVKCNPATMYGRLPLRLDLSTRSGAAGFTDIMSIPPSVARRAYQAAQGGQHSDFFYVRRFTRPNGGPDEYVAVTCRLAGGGARVPFALTDVRLSYEVDAPVLFVRPGEAPPPLHAEIAYNGTGRLVGRWEVVLPGEELPEPRDLLTEATLPVEQRGTQRRYTQLQRFNVFLPPTGRFTLPGPDVERLPTGAEGSYLLLLRIEASNDKEGDSDLGAAGAGTGLVHSGGVAGFPMPTLRYVVGGGGSEYARARRPGPLTLLAPAADADLAAAPPVFAWSTVQAATLYLLEVQREDGEPVVQALTRPGGEVYHAPPWLAERAAGAALRWRVTAYDRANRILGRTPWRGLQPGADIAPPPAPEDQFTEGHP